MKELGTFCECLIAILLSMLTIKAGLVCFLGSTADAAMGGFLALITPIICIISLRIFIQECCLK